MFYQFYFIMSSLGILKKICCRSESIVAWLLHRFFYFQRWCIRHWIIDLRVKMCACSVVDIGAVHRRWFIINIGCVCSCRCAAGVHQLSVNCLVVPALFESCLSKLGPPYAVTHASQEARFGLLCHNFTVLNRRLFMPLSNLEIPFFKNISQRQITHKKSHVMP